ncbi:MULTISPECIES: hypothetical protein [Clostridium]|nr:MULTISPECIES: hypothetical protein [Clostridium]MDU2681017.1 hypothetical protein [Clostridium sp.]
MIIWIIHLNLLKNNIFSYFSSTESIMFKVSNISHIKEDDLFIII